MKKINMLKIALLAASVALSGTVLAGADKAGYDMAMKEAVVAADKAASIQGEWTTIRWKKNKQALIPSAAKAAKKGDYAKAISLLKTAKSHAETGYNQAMEQKNAGPRF
jgi:hypothetical protein